MTKRSTNLEARVSSIEATFKSFMQEMRDRDNQRAEDIRELRQKHDADMKEMNQRFYSKFDAMDKKIDDKFDKLSDQLHTMTIAAVVGFGAIAVAVGGVVYAAISGLK